MKKTHVRTAPAADSTRARPRAGKDIAATYNELKDFKGQRYTGLKVGRGHKWKYDAGEWKETKVTPDLWQFTYAVPKRRAGHAPEGSGVPVGTEYHWYIVAHQNVRKLNANDYDTHMEGMKFKVAHKRANTDAWSATPNGQRKRIIKLLRDTIAQLEREELPAAPTAKKPAPAKADPVVRRAARARKIGRA